jgi:hypothetical protein
VRSRLSQALLDNLAVAWSQFDRARPRHPDEVPSLLLALNEWMRWAVRIDDELLGALGHDYVTSRETHPGGRAIPGLRHAFHLTERQGHPIDLLVTISPGTPALFYDVVWRRYEDLPAPEGDGDGAQAYRLHLASQPARTPASDVTTFLLSTSVASEA